MYKTEKTFNVIQGKVPDFRKIYKEDLLHGTDPVLSGDLVPVNINLENGTVTKADIAKQWYKYEDKQWANAVILTEEGKKKDIKEETIIEEDDIESYFVWIPKYRYKIFDLGNTYTTLTSVQSGKAQEIKIEFGLTNTNDANAGECVAPGSGEIGGCKKDDWMTHPAFIAFDTNGFWVGKFDTGYKDATSKEGAEKDVNDSTKIIIKPNVFSWRRFTIGNAFKSSLQYKRDLDSHMMKNTEWGAVAYLSHSKYGTCNGSQCTEIRLNNSNNYVTGVAAKNEPTTGYNAYNSYENVTPKQNGSLTFNYLDSASTVASTTGNYTGIYDMSGGAWKYVMGVMTSATTASNASVSNIYFSSSGLNSSDLTDSKYYDLYIYANTNQNFNRRILGDATGELGPFGLKNYRSGNRQISSWYEDETWFSNNSYPWFCRSGDRVQGSGAGIFTFNRGPGNDVNDEVDYAFRVVLSPQLIK